MTSVSNPRARSQFGSVEKAIHEAVRQGVFPGAAVLAARGAEVLLAAAYGFRSLLPERQVMEIDDVFDVASLTKPLATASALMGLVQERKLSLDQPIQELLPTQLPEDKTGITVRQLLAHTSGLPAWRPYYRDVLAIEAREGKKILGSSDAKGYIYDRVQHEDLVAIPGTQGLYSDLGFILLGQIVEEAGGLTLDRYCQERVFAPAGLEATFFVAQDPPGFAIPKDLRFVSTQQCPWRGQVLCGAVDDDNAYAMGGVAGHAGLFSRLRDIHQWLSCLRCCYQGKAGILRPEVVREFLTPNRTLDRWTYALGWDTPSPYDSSSGRYFSRNSVGHLGFTGTSIWWDLEKDCYIIFLSNRVHPTRENDKIKTFRPYIHDLIMECLLQ